MNNIFSCLQIKTVDWPFEEGGNGANERSILDYLAQNKFDMVINLPLRTSGSRRASSYLTHGYRTRRMAIDYSIPLITDIKCAKLFIEVIAMAEFLCWFCFLTKRCNDVVITVRHSLLRVLKARRRVAAAWTTTLHVHHVSLHN